MTCVNQNHQSNGPHALPPPAAQTHSPGCLYFFPLGCFHFPILLFWLVSKAARLKSYSHPLGQWRKNLFSPSSFNPILIFFNIIFVCFLVTLVTEKLWVRIIGESLPSLAFFLSKMFLMHYQKVAKNSNATKLLLALFCQSLGGCFSVNHVNREFLTPQLSSTLV